MSHINKNTNDVSQADAKNGDKNLEHYDESEIETTESEQTLHKLQIDELKELLEKEKQNSSLNTEKWKRALADYQNLEKRTQQEIIDKVSSETGKLILEFLTVYENFIRAKEYMQKKE